jgi:hypothetical protein
MRTSWPHLKSQPTFALIAGWSGTLRAVISPNVRTRHGSQSIRQLPPEKSQPTLRRMYIAELRPRLARHKASRLLVEVTRS